MSKPSPTKWSLPDDVTGKWLENRVRELVEAHHESLEPAVICILFCAGLPSRHGKRTLGTASVVPEKWRLLTGQDLLIALDTETWEAAEEPHRLALLDHELSHLKRKTDGDGNEVEDDQGRPVFRTVGHDLEEFNEIWRRHGAWKGDLEAALEAIADSPAAGQLRLDIDRHAREATQ